MKFAIKIVLVLFILLPEICKGQDISASSISKYNKIAQTLQQESDRSVSNLMIKAAKAMLGTAYVGGTLEQEPERLIVNLDKTDCIIFVETCLAMAVNANKNIYSPDSLCATIQKSRYRNGIIDGYTSRIHYTSEWILEEEKNGIAKEITAELSNNTLSGQQFNFISSNMELYKQLKDFPCEVVKIMEMEKNLNKNKYYIIPKEMVPSILGQLKDGDIICFNTNKEGLDISHVGIVYFNNGNPTFIHASQSLGKVVIETKGIVNYINGIKTNNGIRIVRPN